MIARTIREHRRRGGYGLAEVAMALLLLMAAMTFTVKALGLAAAERKSADQRLCATLAVSNVLERATAHSFDDVSEARVRSLLDAEHADDSLPGADWRVEVVDDPIGKLAAKRITARLRWKQRSENWDAPVRISAWVFPDAKGARP
jgi:hypothetical protein